MKSLYTILIIAVAFSIGLVSNAQQNQNSNVDTFVPSAGVKVKPSPLAQMMENATKNATQPKKQNNNTSQNNSNNGNNKNTSSWF